MPHGTGGSLQWNSRSLPPMPMHICPPLQTSFKQVQSGAPEQPAALSQRYSLGGGGSQQQG